MKRIRFFTWVWEKVRRKKDTEETNKSFLHTGLQTNMNMPTTGEEAMKRLLACKGKDPYSILGVTPTCTDDDIKRYYKRQAFLVHPDKNQQPGAEEAFKILVHAFDMIGEPERRASYDRGNKTVFTVCFHMNSMFFQVLSLARTYRVVQVLLTKN